MYDRLFLNESPDEASDGKDFTSNINPASLTKVEALIEPGLLKAKPGEKFQFERLGYFCVDKYSEISKPVFNRTVTLRDSWAKANK